MSRHAIMYRRGRRYLAMQDFYFDWILGPARWGTFPFRHPRLWWYCRRIAMHYRWGLPMPAGYFHA
jgi:hypothetical protein